MNERKVGHGRDLKALLSGHIARPTQTEGLILNNIFGQNPKAASFIDSLVKDVSPESSPDSKTRIKIAGFEASSKSLASIGLISRLNYTFRIMYPDGDQPLVLFHDFIDSVVTASKMTDQNGNPLVNAKIGGIDHESYLKIADVDKRIKYLVYKFVPGRVVLIEEVIMTTENFDSNWEPQGNPRGSIQDAKDSVNNGQSVYIAFVVTPEAQRRKNIADREAVKNAPPGKVFEVLKSQNITLDTDDEAAVRSRYANYTEASAMQHVYGMFDVLAPIIDEVPEYRAIPGISPYIDGRISTREALQRHLEEEPEFARFMLEQVHIHRLGAGIFSHDIRTIGERMQVWFNPPLPSGFNKFERRQLLEDHRAISYLQEMARKPESIALREELRALKLEPSI